MKKLMTTLLVTGTVLGTSGMALAEETDSPTSISSKVTTEVIPGDDLVDPNPGPYEPFPAPTPNPGTDVYGIRYVSNLDFGKVEFSTEEQTLSTEFDADLKGENDENIYSYALVRDIRPEAEREGWHVTVQQDNEFIPGSTLTFAPKFSDKSAGFTSEDLNVPSTLAISQSPSTFMSTVTDNNPAGVGAMVTLGEVELVVPANTGVGEYSTNLLWNLVAGPSI